MDVPERKHPGPINPEALRLYCVCFLDLLGQGEQLNKLRSPRSTPASELGDALESTLGKVLHLRDLMSHFIRMKPLFEAGRDEIFRDFPEELRPWLTSASDPRLDFQHFSDSLIAYAELLEADRAATSFVISSILVAARALTLRSFANHAPLRGGIELGFAVEWEPHQLYGPVLKDAYYLESKIAEYPRVLVGKELHAVLTDSAAARPTGPVPFFERYFAELALSLLRRDTDDWYILDFLGPHPAGVYMPDLENLLRSAVTFIRSESIRLENDEKLGPRYERLVSYCAVCEQAWAAHGAPLR